MGGPLGAFLGSLGMLLGAVGCLGGPLGVPGGSWGVPGRFGGDFRDFPGNSGRAFGIILGSFLVHFAIENRVRNQIVFFMDFGSFLG